MPIAGSVQNEICGLNNNCRAAIAASSARKEAAHAANETVLNAAHVYFSLMELDMRSAQNALRLKRALQSEDLPFEKLRFALNRAPKFTDLSGKSRVKRMAESLGISIDLQLPDGGKPVTQCGDHGMPMAASAAKNPLRKEIAKLAQSLHELGQSEAKAA